MARPRDAQARAGIYRAVGVVTFAAAGFLLLSFGGAIVGAPVTLPLMYLAARRHPTRAFRYASVIIGGLTAAEVGWALTYVTVGESRPWIWLLPAFAAIAASVGFAAGAPSQQGAHLH